MEDPKKLVAERLGGSSQCHGHKCLMVTEVIVLLRSNWLDAEMDRRLTG